MGIIGRDGGYAGKNSDAIIIIPTVDKKLVTPYSESFQAVVWHLLVAHPILLANEMKWESVK